MSLPNAPGEWRWEQRGLLWWRIHDNLNITDGPYQRRWDWTADDETAFRTNAAHAWDHEALAMGETCPKCDWTKDRI